MDITASSGCSHCICVMSILPSRNRGGKTTLVSAHSECSDGAAVCSRPQSAPATSSGSACHCILPSASDPMGPLLNLEGSSGPAWQLSSVFKPLVYTRPTLGSSIPVTGGAGLGSAASPSVGGAGCQPTIKAHLSFWRQASSGNTLGLTCLPRVLPRPGSG